MLKLRWLKDIREIRLNQRKKGFFSGKKPKKRLGGIARKRKLNM